jgi:hypothetical protein
LNPEAVGSNPFPGLRSFEPEEGQLFFGREKEVNDLLRKLRRQRFLAVVGSSGCGKSSLVRSGLLPALRGAQQTDGAGAVRVALLRPGGDPIGNLARALSAPGVLDAGPGLADTNRVLIEATLRRGTLGLVEAVRHSRADAGDRAIVVVDQFEELFRLRQATRAATNTADEAVAFAKLLLEAAAQKQTAIYVIVTMRSDFIGDCMDYPGLPEAINEGQYLVPRMTREELRKAITGPVSVAGGKIASRLVIRLLNDMGDSFERLPLCNGPRFSHL